VSCRRISTAQLNVHHLSFHYPNRPIDAHTTGNGGVGRREHEVIDRYSDFVHVGRNLHNLIYLAEVPIKGNNASSQRQTFLLVSRNELFLPCTVQDKNNITRAFRLQPRSRCDLHSSEILRSA